jgi:hypothetical protein
MYWRSLADGYPCNRRRPSPWWWCKSSLDRVTLQGGSLDSQCRRGGFIGGLVGRGQYGAGSGEDIEFEVASAFNRFVVLFS